MELVKLDLQDGYGEMTVCVATLEAAYRLRAFMRDQENASDKAYHQGYSEAIEYAKRAIAGTYTIREAA